MKFHLLAVVTLLVLVFPSVLSAVGLDTLYLSANLFLEGELFTIGGTPDSAAFYLREALSLDKESEIIFEGLISSLLEAKKYKEILTLSDSYEDRFRENPLFWQAVFDASMATLDYSRAEYALKRWEKLIGSEAVRYAKVRLLFSKGDAKGVKREIKKLLPLGFLGTSFFTIPPELIGLQLASESRLKETDFARFILSSGIPAGYYNPIYDLLAAREFAKHKGLDTLSLAFYARYFEKNFFPVADLTKYLEISQKLGVLPRVPDIPSVKSFAPNEFGILKTIGLLSPSIDPETGRLFIDQALSLFEDAELHRLLANIQLSSGEYDSAITHFRMSLFLSDTSIDSWMGLIQAYGGEKDTISAREFFEIALGRFEDTLSLVRAMENAYERPGDKASALSFVEHWLPSFPDNEELLFLLGHLLVQTGEKDTGYAVFEAIIAKDPDNALAMNYLGYSLVEDSTNLEYAETLLTKAIELEPGNAMIVDSYGWLMFKKGEIDSAYSYIKAASDAYPDPEILYHRGRIEEAKGETDEARESYREAIKASPRDERLRELIERALERVE